MSSLFFVFRQYKRALFYLKVNLDRIFQLFAEVLFINYLIRRLENDREGFIKEYGKSFVDLLERAKNLKGKFKSATDTDIGKSSEPDKK